MSAGTIADDLLAKLLDAGDKHAAIKSRNVMRPSWQRATPAP